MSTQLTRDPFARATLMRRLVPKHDRKDCTECGQQAKFYYHWEQDSMYGRMFTATAQQFCSVSCARGYGAI